jgi:hypothetical protein
MKIKTHKIGNCEVRWTQQNPGAHYGASSHVIRLIINGRKSSEKSFAAKDSELASARFDEESRYADSFAQETGFGR